MIKNMVGEIVVIIAGAPDKPKEKKKEKYPKSDTYL